MNLILFVDLKKELPLAWQLTWKILWNIFIIISNYSSLSFSCLKKNQQKNNPNFYKVVLLYYF